MRVVTIDEEKALVTVRDGDQVSEYPIGSEGAFEAVSRSWLRVGWDIKHVYTFTWMGRPIIQLPEDVLRIQELIYSLKPDYIIETGVAHGGSLVFYATLCKAYGKGHVIGVDVEIRPHNRNAIEEHELSPLITLLEGSSTDPDILRHISETVEAEHTVVVILDSNHSKNHVLAELKAYSKFVSPGSYIVVCDGIMRDVVGAPRTKPDWVWDNPVSAIDEFCREDGTFIVEEPPFAFNESNLTHRVTYWPRGFLKRVR